MLLARDALRDAVPGRASRAPSRRPCPRPVLPFQSPTCGASAGACRPCCAAGVPSEFSPHDTRRPVCSACACDLVRLCLLSCASADVSEPCVDFVVLLRVRVRDRRLLSDCGTRSAGSPVPR
ncbi:hypothetical protein DL89DRAFT_76992 [Linderina pennispora]|uniref:Uncharacterized protein n=1 Tax=Linderina pennispora TaxID=61395 RepID=A0A1Y1VQI7_9FUNG|nr:uncharacterized protein DL89DRAFT_76992 [Linderina pennispora]ORX63561.1 hypothetical protein DL89DRAFT_76992 [Linderina pennispora]